jgi:PAS domain S-box-containing protein
MFNHTTIAFDDCVLAYDLSEQKYLFISPGVYPVLGITAKQLYENNCLWDGLINKQQLARIKDIVKNLTENSPVELSYSINTPQHIIKNISDKKTLIIDEATGHKILLSIIKEAPTDKPEKPQQQADAGLSKQFLTSLIDSQTSFLIRIDINGNYSFINSRYLKTFGYKAEELLGKHFSITTIPEEARLCEDVFINCLNNPGKIIPLLHKKTDIHGNLHDTEWEFISMVNENGKVCEIQGIGHDITNRRKIEAEIIDTAQKLDTFIESITDSFFILDNSWRFVRINYAFEKITNRSREHVLGKVIWDIFPSIAGTGFERAFYEAKIKQTSIKFIEDFTRINRWFNVAVYPSAGGLTVFVKDITDEKRAQEEAMSIRNSLEALINNTTDQIWSVDTATRYVYMNHAYVKQITALTGMAPQKGDHSYMQMGCSNQIINDWKSYYQRALNGEQYTIIKECACGQTKEALFYEISFNPIYSVNNEIMGVGCFARDITTRLKTEQALLSQNKRLRNIASLSSHELRRPVASMLGLLNIIDRENLSNPENKNIIDYLHIVSTEIDDAIHLIVDHTFTGD